MNQRASHEKLKAQIEAAKQGLANWPIEPPANDAAIAVITPAHTNDADNGNNEFGFQFFHRAKLKPEGGVSVPLSPETGAQETGAQETCAQETGAQDRGEMTIAQWQAVDAAAFDMLHHRLDVLETEIAKNCNNIKELIDLLSRLDAVNVPAKTMPRRKGRAKHLFAFWSAIGVLAIGWYGLTPAGHSWIVYVARFF